MTIKRNEHLYSPQDAASLTTTTTFQTDSTDSLYVHVDDSAPPVSTHLRGSHQLTAAARL